jgi:hypothetical protein
MGELREVLMRKRLWVGIAGLALCSCGSGLGEVTVQEVSSSDPSLPHITVDRLQKCFSDHGGQLLPGRHQFNSVVEVDRNGMKWGVSTPNMPDAAPDLAACTRIALQDMAIPSSVFNLRSTQSAALSNEVTPAQRSFMGNPAVAVVVIVGLSELVFEAGAYTILFAVSVKVVEKAAKDIAEKVEEEGWKAKGAAHYATCMATTVAGKSGNHWQQTRCGICLAACTEENGWPDEVGNGSCEYWRRNWR